MISIANERLACAAYWMAEGRCVVPASACRCVRPLLGGEGAGEGEPTSMHRSPAREVEETVEGKRREKSESWTRGRKGKKQGEIDGGN